MARIGTSVVSKIESFMRIIFCKEDGEDDRPPRAGGARGGNGDVDIAPPVGEAKDEEELEPRAEPRLELYPERIDEGLRVEVFVSDLFSKERLEWLPG